MHPVIPEIKCGNPNRVAVFLFERNLYVKERLKFFCDGCCRLKKG
jgi:hypothetical protein